MITISRRSDNLSGILWRRRPRIGRSLAAVALAAAALSIPTAAIASDGKVSTPFTASYTNPTPTGDSFWTCSGLRSAEKHSIKDKETCLISGDTTGFVAGTYVGHPTVNVPPFGVMAWASDYDGLVAKRFTARIVDNQDGTFTQYLIAFYS